MDENIVNSFYQDPAASQGVPTTSHPEASGPPAPEVLHIPRTAVLASSLILVTRGFSYFFFSFSSISTFGWFVYWLIGWLKDHGFILFQGCHSRETDCVITGKTTPNAVFVIPGLTRNPVRFQYVTFLDARLRGHDGKNSLTAQLFNQIVIKRTFEIGSSYSDNPGNYPPR